MDVPAQALATFDELAARAGLSRPKMFARLMAIEAQELRLARDLDTMAANGEPNDEDAKSWEGWVRANPPGWLA